MLDPDGARHLGDAEVLTASVPLPSTRGAMPTTSRSASPSDRNDVITRAPPSTSTDRIPSPSSAQRRAEVDTVRAGRHDQDRHATSASSARRSAEEAFVVTMVVAASWRARGRRPGSGARSPARPDRRVARHHADRELRIVRDHGSDAHEHRVARGAEGVRRSPLLFPADPPGVAGRRGDPPVERLGVLEGDVGTRRPGADLAEERADVRWRPRRPGAAPMGAACPITACFVAGSGRSERAPPSGARRPLAP